MKRKLMSAIIIIIAVMFVTGVSYSQKGNSSKTPEEMAVKISDKLKSKLSLTDDQYKQVYSMALSHAKEMKENKAKFQSMDKQSRRELRDQSRQNFRKELETVLNQDQIKKLNEMKQHKHDKKRMGKK